MKLTQKLMILLFLGVSYQLDAQAIRDRNVIPVAVNLNQVLRMTISDGGNIEFVFNSINDYRLGLSGDQATSGSANTANAEGMYQSTFSIASSTEWDLAYGAENATFIGTDNSTNTLTLDNVGFTLTNGGTNTIGATAADQVQCPPTTNSTVVANLDAYDGAVELLQWNTAGPSNAGDVTENNFTMIWRCGTAEGDMNANTLLTQTDVAPDRYVTNVMFELKIAD